MEKRKKRPAPNPTGKGGFRDNPQNINRSGRWDPNKSPSMLLRKYTAMTEEQLVAEARKPDLTALQKMLLQQVLAAVDPSTPQRVAQQISERIYDRIERK